MIIIFQPRFERVLIIYARRKADGFTYSPHNKRTFCENKNLLTAKKRVLNNIETAYSVYVAVYSILGNSVQQSPVDWTM